MSAAERLTAQINEALAAVSDQTSLDAQELDARADRLERAARDMTVALRELAEKRGQKDS